MTEGRSLAYGCAMRQHGERTRVAWRSCIFGAHLAVACGPPGVGAAIGGPKPCAGRARPAVLRQSARDGSRRSKRKLPRADGLMDLVFSLRHKHNQNMQAAWSGTRHQACTCNQSNLGWQAKACEPPRSSRARRSVWHDPSALLEKKPSGRWLGP